MLAKLSVLLVGKGYFPFRVAGDKNFFLELTPLLVERGAEVAVFSVNDQEEETFLQRAGSTGKEIKIHNVKRPFHLSSSLPKYFGRAGNLHYYHHLHSAWQEVPEIFLTILANLPRLRQIIKTHGIQVIHFMDNFGPAMALVKKCFPDLMVTASALTYCARGRHYDLFYKYSYKPLDCTVCYTEDFARKFRTWGHAPKRLAVIHWSVRLPSRALLEVEKKALRTEYGVTEGHSLLLWSGELQNIKEEDFFLALETARTVTGEDPTSHFVFAFKPESFRPEYKKFAGERIEIITNVQDFRAFLEAADFLFSPMASPRVIVAPPLTWIEAMARGTPVITTMAGGVRELVVDGSTGFVSPSRAELASTTLRALRDGNLSQLMAEGRRLVAKRFNTSRTADEYLALWRRRRKN